MCPAEICMMLAGQQTERGVAELNMAPLSGSLQAYPGPLSGSLQAYPGPLSGSLQAEPGSLRPLFYQRYN